MGTWRGVAGVGRDAAIARFIINNEMLKIKINRFIFIIIMF